MQETPRRLIAKTKKLRNANEVLVKSVSMLRKPVVSPVVRLKFQKLLVRQQHDLFDNSNTILSYR